jgi:hypothetical protein
LDFEASIQKKNIVEVIFIKLHNGRVIQDGATSHCLTLLGLAPDIYQPILTYKPILDLHN